MNESRFAYLRPQPTPEEQVAEQLGIKSLDDALAEVDARLDRRRSKRNDNAILELFSWAVNFFLPSERDIGSKDTGIAPHYPKEEP